MNIRETLRIERGTYLSLDFLPEVDKTLPCLHRCDDTRLHNVEVCQSEETKRSSRVQTLLIPVVGAAFVVLAPFVSVLEGPIDSQQIKGLESWFVPLKHRVLLL